MTFAEAISELGFGEKIRRQGWMPGAIICVSPEGDVIRVAVNQASYGIAWYPKLADLTATDWEIHVPRPGEPA